jgi:hypothetical protein
MLLFSAHIPRREVRLARHPAIQENYTRASVIIVSAILSGSIRLNCQGAVLWTALGCR